MGAPDQTADFHPPNQQGENISEILTEENQHHEGSGIWIHCTLASSKAGGSSGCLLMSTQPLSTETAAVPDSQGRTGGSGPEWRSPRSPG